MNQFVSQRAVRCVIVDHALVISLVLIKIPYVICSRSTNLLYSLYPDEIRPSQWWHRLTWVWWVGWRWTVSMWCCGCVQMIGDDFLHVWLVCELLRRKFTAVRLELNVFDWNDWRPFFVVVKLFVIQSCVDGLWKYDLWLPYSRVTRFLCETVTCQYVDELPCVLYLCLSLYS